MKVSEVARRAGIASSAVRWYESVGAIPVPPRTRNGYRAYEEADVARLRLVVALRRLGLAPLEAGRLATLMTAGEAASIDLLPYIEDQRAAIARQRDDLARLDAELTDLEHTIAAASSHHASREHRAMSADPIRVLFVCTGNSARSQIAEALLVDFGGTDFEVHSAGTEPKGVNPYTVRALAEAGIDWSGATSDAITRYLGESFDYVITVCDRARETCPVFPGSRNALHWGLDDPAEVTGTDEEKLAAFRRTRLEVATRLRPFIEVALRAAGRRAGSLANRSVADH